MDPRETKGREIAARGKLQQEGNRWFVPSQSGRTGMSGGGSFYTVKPDPANPHCTCPDFEFRKKRCKHIFAVEFTIQREYTNDGQTETLTETVTVKKTYRQEWPAYNAAQTQEKDQFQSLLGELVKGVGEPSQKMGRPRLPFSDMIFSAVFKVYSTVSGRRFMCDLKGAHEKGLISKLPHYNSIFNYFENEALTPYLQMLIEESSLPLQTIESDFAVDSSGFSTCRFFQWADARYSNQALMTKRDWVKVHLMCGVKTNIVTAVEITDRYAADVKYFKPLVEQTGHNFTMAEVSADKAYLSAANLQTVVDNHAMPYIPFKVNSLAQYGGGKRQQQNRTIKWRQKSTLWRRMYHYYMYNQTWFLQQYHKRSNVESTFSMIKAKFGDSLRSKTKTAQVNEALCKILAHNICCLIQSVFEFKIDAKFWAEETLEVPEINL
jgi:transposase